MNTLALLAMLTCPNPACGHRQQALMPTTCCQLFYTCEWCLLTHRYKQGDCCVFCSYADKPCPPVQEEGACCPKSSFDQGISAPQG